ncbi:putative Ig domain-containing protein [Romeria aff. gracilis LEGE 07310]|uniref:Putative Ig domain-containing protein n=1 Tax=Vasconcelosia minhoensis LEGE 07310 TaxID=915328 RepID=A0A8J7AW93_9CYAN|nr:putative Ig domain-containing protein [Romeria gracilis]MBE9078258.1 putative Ig domain-containing protein [Romeria aff. gracilis LEGE 07310]
MLAESGTYRLVIDGNDDRVGEYKFRLLDKAAAALITLDQEVIGRFPDSRQSDLYRFTGSTGQYVYVNQQVGGSPNQWYLFGPGGLRVSSEYIYNDQEFALPADGEYWLVMRGNGSSNLNYKFTLVTPEFSTQNLSLNQTISGTLTEPGENDTYTFNGAIGQQLFFDALNSNSPGFTVRLYSPTNQQVYSSAIQSDWRLDRTFVLSESGTYRLVIDGDGDRTGDYSFRLLDKAAATLINLDQEVTGKFTDSRQSDLYRFTGSTGQYMYVNQQMGSSNEWYLFGPGGLKVSSDQIYDDQEFVLPADGEYLLVMQGKGYTPSDYQFTLVTPEFVTQALPLNQVISGTLTEPGENDTYTFSGAIGQQLFFDALSATYFRAKLYDPIGREVFNLDSRYDRGPSDGLLLSMNGTYRVVIDGVGDRTGDYKFRLLDKAAATVVSFNTEVKGTFEQDGIGSELYRFTGVAGQSIYLDTGSGQYPNSWILYGPGGQHISNGYVQDNYNYSYADDYEFTLPATGEYLLVMQGKGAVNVNFKFKLVTPETLSTSLTIGTLVTGNISNAGEQDIYTFDGIVGQQLYFDALKGNSNLKARLIGPGGAVVLDKNTNGDWGGFNLTETGTYRLLIDGEKATTGEYSFILSDRALSPALTLDTAIAGSLNPGNQAKLYQFTGKTGQRLKFALEAASWNGANWVLYNPSGGIAKAPTASSPDFAATIGADGLYTLAILGNSSAPISYSFKVTDLQAEQITNTGLNTIQSGSLSAGQVNDYSFSATAGTLIYLDSHTNSSTWYLRTRLLNPDGTFVFNNEDARNNRGPILLEQSGTYTLQTYGTYSNTIGNYQFNLLELPRDIASPNPNALRIGEINTENLSSRQSKVYIFEGAIGEKFALNALVGQNVKATVYDPNGSQLFSNSLYWYGDSKPLTLSQSGLYYLVVENYDTASQNYSFQLLNISNLPEIRYGLPVSGSLKNGQENHFYKLQAQAGERLFFDHLTTTAPNSNFRWKLFGPSNNLLFDTALQSDFEFAIPTTGEYYLKIEGGNTLGKVDYSYRVLKHTAAVRDVIIPGTGETAANDTDSLGLIPVQLSVKDSRRASSVQNFNVKLWADPDNGNPIITSIPEPRFSLADKVYRYQLKSIDPDADNLSYRLLESPLGALIDNESGEILWYPENTVNPGSTVNFKVEASDRRGGKAVQSFSVDVFSSLGKIQGVVFNDLNGNGIPDSKLIKGDNPDVFFVIDVSGSMGGRYVDWTTVDLNTVFDQALSPLDQELGSIIALSDFLIARGFGDTSQIGVITSGQSLYDMDPSMPGIQVSTTPLADNNNNGIRDILEVLNRQPGGGGSDTSGLETAWVLQQVTDRDANIIFMSDGFISVDTRLVADIKADGVNIQAFGFAQNGMDTMRLVEPNALYISSPNSIENIFSGFDTRYILEPLMENVTVYLDLNENGVLDVDEPFQITKSTEETNFGDSRYQFSFDDLLPGTYTIRQVIPSGYTQTSPSSYSFVDTVTVAGGEAFTHWFGLNKVAEPPNQDPAFHSIAPSPALKLGEHFLYRAVAHDPDANPLTYDLPLGPEGMVIDQKTGELTWIPKANQVGKFNVILRVKDDQGGFALQTFTGEVLPKNTAPLFTSALPATVKPQVGNLFQYQAKAIDADGDTLTYSLLTGAPNGMTIDATTGLLRWTPTAVGTQEATIKVIDGKGGESLQKLALTVNPAAANQAPTITSTPRTTVQLGNTFFYQVSTSDAEGDRVSYSLETAPAGMTLQDGVISWTPTAAQSGTHPVTIKVSDGKLATTQSFPLTVAHQSVNYAPTITSAPNLVTNLEQTYVYDLVGSDPDGDRVFWSLEKAPSGMVIDAETGALRWQPQPGQIGTHQVLVKITDAAGLESAQEFTLKVTGTNTPPAILSTPITRAAQGQAYSYTVVATDPENDPIAFSLGRRPEGMTIGSDGIIRWTPKSTQLGAQLVEVLATDSQGGTTTQRFTVEVGTAAINHAPTITSTPVFLAMPTQGYVYQVQATDIDAGDMLTYQLLDGPTGMTIDAATGKLEWAMPTIGAHQVVVGAVDSKGVGAAQGFTLTVRQNHAPVITSTAPETAMLGTTYRYDVRATDADGDRIFYRLDPASLAQGLSIDALGRIAWTPTVADIGQSYPVTITVTDEQGATQQQSFTLSVAQDTQAPTVTVFATQSLVDVGSTVTLVARATDNVRVANLTLVVGGQAVVLDANGRATLRVEQAGELTAVAAAIDAAGNRSQATTTIQVIDPTAPFDPDLSFDLPEVVTAPTQFNVAGTGVVGYKLEVAPIAGGQWRTLTEKQGDIATDETATFDPSLLENDTYLARLTLYGANGSVVFVEDTVSVAGELKLGNFRLSFTDLSIPVAGIPISLTRTYDSLTAYTTDDFGFGWRMEFRDTDLRTSLRRTEEQELVGIYPGFKDGTRVYITLPGGQRQGFTFKPTGDRLNQFFGAAPEAALYHPAFEADKGVTSTLTVKDVRITRGGTDQYAGLVGNPYNPADPIYGGIYVLTTKDGTVYEIDGQTGDLLTVTDANGNRLTYTDESITSSTGQKVTFERDSQNRITAVKDLMGELIRYSYDAMGDLVAVTDRLGNTTRLVYDAERQHYLKEIIDPLGRSGVKSEYDENGRLRKLLDVNGEAVELVYDPANSQQTVKDVFGNPTTYVYDQRGNVVTEVDALGGITQRTYDRDDNLLSETDPDGIVTTYTYDNSGNTITIKDSAGNITYMSYGQYGRLQSVTSPTGLSITFEYDKRGNLLSSTDSNGLLTTYQYDSRGRLLKQVGPDGQIMVYGYDALGNPNRMVDSRGNEVTSTYDRNGRMQKATTEFVVNGETYVHSTSFIYDSEGRTLSSTNAQGNTQSNVYNSLGQVVSTIDILGNVTSFVYDDAGRVIGITLPDNTPDNPDDNPKVFNEYDLAGRLISETSATGLVTRYSYDVLGRLIETILPDETPDTFDDNPRITTEYTVAGRIKARTDVFGNRETYEYDSIGRLIRKTDILGNKTDFAYTVGGQVASVTDLRDRATQFVYDDKSRLTETHYFDGTKATFTYDKLGRVVAETNQLNQTTQYKYDAFGQVIAVIDALGERTVFEYDTRQNLVKVTNALGYTTYYEYDQYNRQVATRYHTGDRIGKGYDSFNRLISITDENGYTTRYDYSNLNQLTTISQANGALTNYTYDILGRLTQIEDPNQNVTRYAYDAFNRTVSTTLPMGQQDQMVYDKFGLVSSYTDFNGDTLLYTYDQYGRITQKSFSNTNVASVSYTYDPVTSQLIEVTDGRGTTSYHYDERDRLAAITNPDGKSVGYGYDVLNNLTLLKTEAGQITYTYDALNRLDTVQEAGRLLADYDYDAVSNLIQTRQADGTSETRQYNARNRLIELETKDAADNLLSSYRYTLDAVGNRTQVFEHSGRTVSYVYDEVNRLTEEAIIDSVAGNRTVSYSYDLAGNRLSRNDSVNGLTSYLYDANNRLTQMTLGSEVTQFAYDANGSMLSRSNGTESVAYTWLNDGENRLIGITINDGDNVSQISYLYDAFGNRVTSIANGEKTNYLSASIWNLPQVLLTYDENGQVITDYTYGLDLIRSREAGTERIYHQDGLGSTRLLTDNTGQVIDRYVYDAYGRLIAHDGNADNAYQFAGEQRDSQTGLDYLRARYYDSDLGRFISKDAFSGMLGDPMSQHDYQYAHANPVNFTDPTGYFSLQEALSVTAMLSITASLGASAGYLGGAIAGGSVRSAEDLVSLLDQWVAGFAHFVSFGATTYIRNNYIGGVAPQHHSGFLWNMGQLAGAGTALLMGAAVPDKLSFTMGRAAWLATAYEGASSFSAAWQTGTNTRNGQLGWSDAFTLLPLIPFALSSNGTKAFLGAAQDVNQRLKNWGNMNVSAWTGQIPKGTSKEIGTAISEIGSKEEAAARIAGALRYKILGTNLEQGGKFSPIEALGATRIENIIGRRLSPSDIEGVDFIDGGNLGKIQLKGPYLTDDLQPLSPERQQKAIASVLRKIQGNTAPDTFVIDTLGLSNEAYTQLNQAVQQLPNAQKVRFIR